MRINHDFRGKGYGTSALKLLLDYAFNERRLHKFNATLVDGNIASESMNLKFKTLYFEITHGCNQSFLFLLLSFKKASYNCHIFQNDPYHAQSGLLICRLLKYVLPLKCGAYLKL